MGKLKIKQKKKAFIPYTNQQANRGEMSVLSMMQDIEENTDVRFDEMNKNLVKKMGV